MQKETFRLIEKKDLYSSGKLWKLKFDGPYIEARPGQFVNIEVEGQYLRRPISISEYENGILSLIIDAVGTGTKKIVESEPGAKFDMLTGLGNPFTLHPPARNVLVLGGGVGYAPLVGLLKKIRSETSLNALAVFGYNREQDVPFYHICELQGEGYPVVFGTILGEMGEKGNVLEIAEKAMKERDFEPEFFYACGPWPMMRAVCEKFDIPGQLSLEARMGCGFGACMGCTIETRSGLKRICREGTVFDKDDLIF